MEGFGGRGAGPESQELGGGENSERTLQEIAAAAGRALPVVRRADPVLKKMPVVIDFEEMSRRNTARAKGLRIVIEDESGKK